MCIYIYVCMYVCMYVYRCICSQLMIITIIIYHYHYPLNLPSSQHICGSYRL